MSRLSEKLRELRLAKGCSVSEFAALVGKSPGYVSRIEVRGEIPSSELLCVIADIYSISPQVLFELAKISQLERAERDIENKQSIALSLYRKERK